MAGVKLWRYYDLIKFLTLVNGELYFARADVFQDKYEGAVPKQSCLQFMEQIRHKNSQALGEEVRRRFRENFNERKKKAAISCWHINDGESAAMWEVYSKAGLGIAVCTTLEKLKKIHKPRDMELEMFKVDYIDFDREYREDYKHYELLPFKNKRKEFEYEHEFRIMLYKNKPGAGQGETPENMFLSGLMDLPEEGIKLPVNAAEMIDEIVASPHMKKYEVAEIQRILDLINENKGTDFSIRQSKLYENLEY